MQSLRHEEPIERISVQPSVLGHAYSLNIPEQFFLVSDSTFCLMYQLCSTVGETLVAMPMVVVIVILFFVRYSTFELPACFRTYALGCVVLHYSSSDACVFLRDLLVSYMCSFKFEF
jgi:hypothetical protein